MKKNYRIFSFAMMLALVPAFAFADDISQSVNKLNAAKLLVEKGSDNLLEIDNSYKENARNALEILKNMEIPEEVQDFQKTYITVYGKANLILGNYDEVISLWEKTSAKKLINYEELKYYSACSYYLKNDYESCIKILSTSVKDKKENNVITSQLYLLAKAYLKKGEINSAEKIYRSLLNEYKELSEAGKIDYAKILYNQKKFQEACEVISGINTEEAWLITGAASFAQKKYPQAAAYFSKCSGNKEASYLKAYALYKNELWADAGKEFENYLEKFGQQEQSFEIWNIAVQSWLLAGNFQKAEKCCEEYLKFFGKTENRKNIYNIVFKLGDIYSDQKKYEKAIELFGKYLSGNDDYSAECIYKIAVLQEKSGKIHTSSDTYFSVYDRNPVAIRAEESLFRAGEVLYLNNMYAESAPKLAYYADKFSKGEYTEVALYYEFDSYVKTNNTTKAILCGERFSSRYDASKWNSKVLEELYNLYYLREDYKKAQTCAEKLSGKYTGNEKTDWQKKASYMKKILSGGNKELILAEADFEGAGGKETLAGRDKGTAYAKLLFQEEETKNKAVQLAGEILALQEKDIVNERESAAINALIIAEYFYEQNRKAEAAEKYLKAAEYSRMNGDHEKAAFSLYTATECFVHLGKKGNANETANLLKKLYPESKYTTAVRSLLK